MNYNANNKLFTCPSATGYVLDISKNPSYIADNNGTRTEPEYVPSQLSKIYLANQIHLYFNQYGITNIKDNDMMIKFMLKFNASIKTKYIAQRLDTDEKGRVYLVEDSKTGKPLVKNNHYIPKRYDNWLIISVVKKEIYIGLAECYQFLSYCFSLKKKKKKKKNFYYLFLLLF